MMDDGNHLPSLNCQGVFLKCSKKTFAPAANPKVGVLLEKREKREKMRKERC